MHFDQFWFHASVCSERHNYCSFDTSWKCISNIVRNKDTREHESNPVKLAYLEEMVNTAAPHLTPDQLTKLWELVARKANTFVGPDGKLGRTQHIKHTIDTGNAKPIKLPPR